MSAFRLASLLVCLVALPVQAQESGLAFLRIGTNAAGVALGDAHVAYSRDAFSTYWNPAGLAGATSNSAALSHHIWVAEVRTYALAARFRAGRQGGLGLFVTATGSGEFEARERPGDPDGLFSAQFVGVGAAYGRSFGPLRAGVTAKYLAERIYTQSANGYAFDLGLQLDLFRGGLQLGAAVQNLGGMSRLSAESTPLPRTVRAGAAVFPLRILSSDDGAALLNTFITGEVSHVFPSSEGSTDDAIEDPTRVHVGVAAEVLELVMLRAGFMTNNAIRRFSFGGGLGYGALHVDYAFLPFVSGYNSGHVISLVYGW